MISFVNGSLVHIWELDSNTTDPKTLCKSYSMVLGNLLFTIFWTYLNIKLPWIILCTSWIYESLSHNKCWPLWFPRTLDFLRWMSFSQSVNGHKLAQKVCIAFYILQPFGLLTPLLSQSIMKIKIFLTMLVANSLCHVFNETMSMLKHIGKSIYLNFQSYPRYP